MNERSVHFQSYIFVAKSLNSAKGHDVESMRGKFSLFLKTINSLFCCPRNFKCLYVKILFNFRI